MTVPYVLQERSIADSVAEILDAAGYEALVAYSGVDALAKASEFCPNILLSGVLMPGKNGFDLAGKNCGGRIPVLVLGSGIRAHNVDDTSANH